MLYSWDELFRPPLSKELPFRSSYSRKLRNQVNLFYYPMILRALLVVEKNTVTKMMENRLNILVVLHNDQNYKPVVMASVVCMVPAM